jgi:hypothetical protein
MIAHAVWREDAAERLIFDSDLDVFYVVNRRQADVRILAGAGLAATRTALMRVVRELAMLHVQSVGRLILHAAALEIDGCGVAVLGPKRAGKTTLLMHLLRVPRARFIANDRVVVDVTPTVPALRGLPSIVSLRGGTLDLFPEVSAREARWRYAFWHTVAESIDGIEGRPVPRDVDVTPVQFSSLLGVLSTDAAPVCAFVFPCVEPPHRDRGLDLDLAMLTREDAERRLRESVFGGINQGERSSAFRDSRDSGAPPRVEAWCRTLAESVPAFEYRLGADVLADAGHAETIATALTSAGRV